MGPIYTNQSLDQYHYQHQYQQQHRQHQHRQHYHHHHHHQQQYNVPEQPSPCSSAATSVAARQADSTGSPLAASPMPSGMARKNLHDSLSSVNDARNSSAGSSPGTPASVGPATPVISPLLVSKYVADAVAVGQMAEDSRVGAVSFFPGGGAAEAAPCPPPLSPLTGEHAATAAAGRSDAGDRAAPNTKRRPSSEAKTPRRPSTAQGKAPRKSKSKMARVKRSTTTTASSAPLATCGNTLEGEAPPPAMPLSPQKQLAGAASLAGAPFDMPFRADSPLLDVVSSHEGTFAFDAPLSLERPFADTLLPMDSPPQKRRAYQDHCGAGFAMPYGDTAIDYASDDLLAYEQSVTF